MNKRTLGLVVGGVVVAIAAYWGFSQYVAAQITAATEKNFLVLDAQIAKQDLLISQIVELLRTNSADEVTKRIVVDCNTTERSRFDTLLERLSGTISPAEISELESLFHKCARFYADRKSIMAARLEREVEIYGEYVRMYGFLNESAAAELEPRVNLWNQIVAAELALAENFNRLVALQEEIILALKNGQARDSVDIQGTLDEVTDIRVEMATLSKQVETLRSELPSL